MDDPRGFYVVVFVTVTTLVSLLLFRGLYGLVHRRPIQARGTRAEHFVLGGQIAAVFLVSASTVHNSIGSDSLKTDIVWTFAYGITALVLLFLSGELGVRLLLRGRLDKEIKSGNVAAGVAAGCLYAAAGIITASAIAGEGVRELGLSVGFFLLATVALHLLTTAFRALTTYDDAEQIAGENLAAAISFGGASIAFAIFVGRATTGEFTTWNDSLLDFARSLALCVALYPMRQLVVQTFVLGAPLRVRGGRIDDAIAARRDVSVAVLEAVTYVATALAALRFA
ncbi:hypothetical protein BH09MYX1_BH09MYX1_02670 [soil metagenome]